jgi:hypothetical protein
MKYSSSFFVIFGVKNFYYFWQRLDWQRLGLHEVSYIINKKKKMVKSDGGVKIGNVGDFVAG